MLLFPLLDGPLQDAAQLLLLLDEFGGNPAGHPATAVAVDALEAVELFGGLFEPLGQRLDEFLFLAEQVVPLAKEVFEVFGADSGHGVFGRGRRTGVARRLDRGARRRSVPHRSLAHTRRPGGVPETRHAARPHAGPLMPVRGIAPKDRLRLREPAKPQAPSTSLLRQAFP